MSAKFEHGVYEVRGWRFEWTEEEGLKVFHDEDPLRENGLALTHAEVEQLFDTEPR